MQGVEYEFDSGTREAVISTNQIAGLVLKTFKTLLVKETNLAEISTFLHFRSVLN